MSYRKKHINPKIKKLRKTKKFFQKAWFWYLVLCLIIICTTIYFFIFSHYFKIKSITISGNQTIAAADIENVAWGDVNKNIFTKNIFMASTQTITKDLLASFADIETVQVSKNFPQTMTLKIKERSPFGVFCNSDSENCFSLDKNGVIFQSLASIPSNTIIIKSSLESGEAALGKTVVAKNVMQAISDIQTDLKNNFQLAIQTAQVANTVAVTTSEGWQIYFNPDNNIPLQLLKLNSLLNGEITPTIRKKLQYIYLQYQDKAYYK